MNWINRVFLEHPRGIGESYWQHFKFAFRFSMQIIKTGFCLLMHGIFPCLFKNYTRDNIIKWQSVFLKRNPLTVENSHEK